MLSAPGACPAVAWLRTARVNAAVNAPAIACCAGAVAVTTTTPDPSPWVSCAGVPVRASALRAKSRPPIPE